MTGKAFSIEELARIVDGRILGDGSRTVVRCSGAEDAGPGCITFAGDDRFRALAAQSRADAIVVDRPLDSARACQIIVPDPRLAFAAIASFMQGEQRVAPGVHPSAFIDPRARVHPGASVGPHATVEAHAAVGAGTRLDSGVFVGEGARIGDDCHLHPNVTVGARCIIGNRVAVHASSVVGADGFGYATTPEGRHVKIPQLGHVVIEDDVEIGACVCIDRARLSETRIGAGTKIDNLVQIAHNVRIGPHCLIVAQAGVAGSTELGRHVVVGGHSGISGHVKLGDGAQISAFSGVSKSLDGGRAYMGVPAIPIADGKRVRLLQLKLPELYARLKAVESELARLGGAAPADGPPPEPAP